MIRTALRFLIVFSFAASAAFAQTTKFRFTPASIQKGGEVKWTIAPGGRAAMEKDEYAIFEGGVTVEYQDIKIVADKLTLNQRTKDVVAEGRVVIDQGTTRVTAAHAVYNLDTKTGTFFKSTASMEPSLSFSGERVEKLDEDTYRMTEGIFTSCDLDRPAWSFHVGSAEVTLDDYAHMKDISFRARGLPIFWAPRLIWPTKRDRSRGFLIPRMQFSEAIGNRIELGYFLPFGESVDATLYAELNDKNYSGGGGTIRYVPSENVKVGQLDAFTIHDPEAGRQQWKYQYQHAQENLPGGFRGVVDVQDFSDLDFFRKYDRDPTLHTASNIYSSAYLTKNRPSYSVNLLADRRDIYLGHVVQNDPTSPVIKQRFEQLPSLQLRMYPQRVMGMPLYFSLESSASHLRTSGIIGGPEADYRRADIFPTLSLQLRTPAWLSVRPQISLRQTYYSASLDPQSPPGTRAAVDESINRTYAQGQVEVVGPSLSRVFNRSIGDFSRFKHVIEPRVRYIFTTDVKEQNRIIRFDTVDSPFLPIVRDSVEYSLTQRVIGKQTAEGSSPREILSFSLRQTASLSKPFESVGRNPGSPFFPSADEKFTPLEASLHVNPYQSVTLDASATFGNVSHQIDQASVSANLVGTGTRADKYLSFTWFSSFRQPGLTIGDSSQIRVNTGSNLWRDRMRADVQINFDAKQGKFLEQRYLIGGTGSCYGLALEFRRYLIYDPRERAINNYGLAITLKNVGTIGTH
ncbi:MAG TPA: LPS assembly protein LptD [Thermoanaerobaculia bacterium]|nr:LPS assembly protein LptD [Thermoanaerobaculia bacterium]